MNTHQRWTQRNISELRARLRSGETLGDITAALARAQGDVLAIMRRLNLHVAPGAAGPT